jgi:cytidylate kinase
MKTTAQIIEEQVQGWERQRFEEKKKPAVTPVITFSREPGSGGSIIAKNLSEQLGMDFVHHEIIHKMAESASISGRLMETIDEKNLSLLDDWISTLVNEKHLWPDQYLRHLLRVVGAIASHGNVIIVGRGASFILRPQDIFRVRVVAPLEMRVQNVARAFNVSYDDAKRRVLKTESDRRAFVRKYFHDDVAAPVNYDLVLNTEKLSLEQAVAAIRSALGR